MTPIRQSFLIGLEPPRPSPPPLHVIHSGTLGEVGKGGSLKAFGCRLKVSLMFGLRRPDLRCAGESGSGICIHLRGGAGNEPCWQEGEFIGGIVPAITALKKTSAPLRSGCTA